MVIAGTLVVVSQGKVEMGVLSTSVKTIVDTLESAAGPLQEVTGHLTRSLALIEIALALVAVLLGADSQHLLRKVLGVATWLWLIGVFHDAAKALMKWLVHAAGSAFGGESEVLLQPSKILDLSTKATEPMIQKLLAMHVAIDIGTALLLALALLAVMLAYIALALSIALALIEFYLYLALSGLLLPFAVFGQTRFVADKAINAVLACAIKLAVISFIVSATAPILQQVKFEPGLWNMLTWHSIWALLVVVGLCTALALWAPRLAAGFLHASPSLSGTAVVAQAASVGAAMVSGAVQMGAAALGAMQGGFAAASAAASAPIESVGAGVSGPSAATPSPPIFVFFADQQRLQAPSDPELPGGDEPMLLPSGGEA
jgi:type IV secretion system protein TrbL